MGIQLLIDKNNQQRHPGKEEMMRGAAAFWILARMASVAVFLGRLGVRTFGWIVHLLDWLKSIQCRERAPRQMKLVESLMLGNQRQLFLVVCDKQRYFVGAGAESLGSIHTIDAAVVSSNRATKKPQLVRRPGRDATDDARSYADFKARFGPKTGPPYGPGFDPGSGPGFDLWH